MKTYLLFLLMLVSISSKAINPQDSLLFKIDKRNQTLIGAKPNTNNTLKEELSLIFKSKGLLLSDSLWQSIRRVINTDSDLDSSIVVTVGNNLVKVDVIRSDKRMLVSPVKKSFSESKGRVVDIETNQKEKIEIGLNGIHIKEANGEEVHVGWNGVHVKEANGAETNVKWGSDTLKARKKKTGEKFYSRNGINVYFGLNGLLGDVPQITTKIYPPIFLLNDVELKPLGSRYVAVEISESFAIAKGVKSEFRLGYGFSFDWYNFMFDHNRLVKKASQGAIFQPMFDTQGKEITFSKNKLTVSYINIPIMPHVVFNKNSAVEMIGLGGYVGYRIDSWTKTVEEKTGNLSRFSSNFNLNPFRYGLRAEFALKKLPNLFFNYDLSPIFEKNSNPQLSGFSFGIRLL